MSTRRPRVEVQKRTKQQSARKPRRFGRFLVADPRICHGQLTFAGTRIFVADVLEMVAEGVNWKEIVRQWHGSITEEAIAEAVSFAGKALVKHVRKSKAEPLSA